MKTRRKPLSPKEVQARKKNAQHSTGPRTEAGKVRVSMNALKYGLYCDRLSYAAMVLLGEDPDEYTKILNGLIASLAPQNEHQHMMVEDLALLRWERCRNQRAQTGLIGQERSRVERERRKVRLHYGNEIPEALQAEVLEHGTYSLPDSPHKFEQILVALRVLMSWVKFKLESDPEVILKVLWGETGVTMRGAGLAHAVRQLRDQPEEATRHDRQDLVKRLEEEHDRVEQRYTLYKEEFGDLSLADIAACFAPRGKTWRLVLRQQWALERAGEKALRLYWDQQAKDRERAQRIWAERDLEYTPEDQAEEQWAARLMAKLTEVFHEAQAQVKAAKAGAGTRDPGLGTRDAPSSSAKPEVGTRGEAGTRGSGPGTREEAPSASTKPVTGSDGESATTPSATAVDEANREGTDNGQPSTDNCQSRSEAATGSEANGEGTGNGQSSVDNRHPANPELRTSDSPCSDTAKMTEQTEYSVENKGSARENKAETGADGQ
jgi:hypothetical protein